MNYHVVGWRLKATPSHKNNGNRSGLLSGGESLHRQFFILKTAVEHTEQQVAQASRLAAPRFVGAFPHRPEKVEKTLDPAGLESCATLQYNCSADHPTGDKHQSCKYLQLLDTVRFNRVKLPFLG